MVDQLLALRAREGLDLLDVAVIVVDSFRTLGWIILAIVAVIVGMLLLTAVQVNPAVGMAVLLLMLPRRRSQRHEREVRETNFFALCGLLLLGGGWSLAASNAFSIVHPVLGLALAACGVWLSREALVERYQARHGGSQHPSIFDLQSALDAV